jgi:hypothetical protein
LSTSNGTFDLEPLGAVAQASPAGAEPERRPAKTSAAPSKLAEPRLRPWPANTTAESASAQPQLRPWPQEGTKAKSERQPLPLPDPRWTVYESPKADSDFNTFTLRNAVPRSVAREVRIETDEDFKVTDAGHWADLSGEANGEFRGNMTINGRANGVRFQIVWYDENDARRSGYYDLPGSGSPF